MSPRMRSSSGGLGGCPVSPSERAEVAEEIASALARLAAEQREQYSRKKAIGLDGQAREHAICFRTFTRAKEVAREHAIREISDE